MHTVTVEAMASLVRLASLKRLLPAPQSCRQGIVSVGIHSRSFSSEGKARSRTNRSESRDDDQSKQVAILQLAIDQLTENWESGIEWVGRSVAPKQYPVISSGSFAPDLALGIGGFPKGRIIEIYGRRASGRTTLVLHAIAETQKDGGYCAFVDADRSFDPALAKVIGVKSDRLFLSQPDGGEEALNLVDTLIQSGSADVIVVDSVAALVPKIELAGKIEVSPVTLQRRLMTQALEKLSHSILLSKTILIFVNQVRYQLNTVEGSDRPVDVTFGSNVVKFYATICLNVKKIGLITKGEEILGIQVLVVLVKNKLATPCGTAQLEIEFDKGISIVSELTELGLKHKLIAKGDNEMYSLNGQSFSGIDAIRCHLTDNAEALAELKTKLREKLIHRGDIESQRRPVESSDEEAPKGI